VLLVSKTRRISEFGAYLHQLMDACGFVTDADLGRAAGIDGSLLSKWRSGSAQPDIDSLRKLAPHLGVRLGDLLVSSGRATAEELGMAGKPPPLPPVRRQEPLVRRVADALADEAIPTDERDRLRRGVQHAFDLWGEWRARPVEPQPQRQ
jgi:transcriptional regulator with XRE-family HTH domain